MLAFDAYAWPFAMRESVKRCMPRVLPFRSCVRAAQLLPIAACYNMMSQATCQHINRRGMLRRRSNIERLITRFDTAVAQLYLLRINL